MELKTVEDEKSAKVHVGFITLPASARLSVRECFRALQLWTLLPPTPTLSHDGLTITPTPHPPSF